MRGIARRLLYSGRPFIPVLPQERGSGAPLRAHLVAPGRHLTGGQNTRLPSRAIPGQPRLRRLSTTGRSRVFDPPLQLPPGEASRQSLGGKNQKIEEQERQLEPRQRRLRPYSLPAATSCCVCSQKHIIHH